MLVEVCANSPASALAAQEAGASRIEFCSELAVGGVTPSRGMLEWVSKHIKIPVHVLIRPRSGDFCYSEVELDCMIRDIETCVELGFAGVVSGCLDSNRNLDLLKLERLKAATGNLHFTFHRAFDRCLNPLFALGQLESMGVNTILTSGQAPGAMEGMPLLKQLLEETNTCHIMPGGGVNTENVMDFFQAGFPAVHLSGICKVPENDTNIGLPMNSPNLLREGVPLISDVEILSEVIRVANT
jgi:copper homeostasis protein